MSEEDFPVGSKVRFIDGNYWRNTYRDEYEVLAHSSGYIVLSMPRIESSLFGPNKGGFLASSLELVESSGKAQTIPLSDKCKYHVAVNIPGIEPLIQSKPRTTTSRDGHTVLIYEMEQVYQRDKYLKETFWKIREFPYCYYGNTPIELDIKKVKDNNLQAVFICPYCSKK